jgi:hypothetical protein
MATVSPATVSPSVQPSNDIELLKQWIPQATTNLSQEQQDAMIAVLSETSISRMARSLTTQKDFPNPDMFKAAFEALIAHAKLQNISDASAAMTLFLKMLIVQTKLDVAGLPQDELNSFITALAGLLGRAAAGP